MNNNNLEKDFIIEVQRRVANVAIGASTARGCEKGTVDDSRAFLINLDLKQISKIRSRNAFDKLLNKKTDDLETHLKSKNVKRDSCRKFLNIFLRDSFYNRYLFDYYKLSRLEPWLEVPLDKHVASGLKSEEGGQKLPKWTGISNLEPEDNMRFQKFAEVVAGKTKYKHRVHLDLKYWRGKQGK